MVSDDTGVSSALKDEKESSMQRSQGKSIPRRTKSSKDQARKSLEHSRSLGPVWQEYSDCGHN